MSEKRSPESAVVISRAELLSEEKLLEVESKFNRTWNRC
jgi:hypothetical protein